MKNKPNAIVVRTYAELNHYVNKFAEGKFNLLGVLGDPGLGKSETFRRAMAGTEHLFVSGHYTPFQLYQNLYDHRNQPTVIDDADSLFETRPIKPLLKALCETKETKLLQWQSKALDDEEGVPKAFATSSKVAVLSNSWHRMDADMRAVVDRGVFLHFLPHSREVHREIVASGWFNDQEVLDFIGGHLDLVDRPSFRNYRKAAELKNARSENWRPVVLELLNPRKKNYAIVRYLLDDASFASESYRAKAFVDLTGQSKATYYRLKEKLDSHFSTDLKHTADRTPTEHEGSPVTAASAVPDQHGGEHEQAQR